MNHIKALWTKPTRWRHKGSEEVWCASILSMLQHHGKCRVFTDKRGSEWLAALKIPGFSAVHVSRLLDDLDSTPAHLWNLGKLYTNLSQTEPTIQTDGDVILGRALPCRIFNAEVCTERLYHSLPPSWFAKCSAPANWREDFTAGNGLSFNCGLFGGQNTKAVTRIARTGFDFALANMEILKGREESYAEIVIEEWAIAREFDGWEVSFLSVTNEAGSGTKHIRSVPSAPGWAYWHVCGPSKTEEIYLEKIRALLDSYSPGLSKRCRDVAAQF